MTMQIRARQLFARRRPALGTEKNPVVLPPHIQFVDSRFRPVEACSHLHRRDRSDYLVDLNDTQKTVPGEPVQQEIHDVRYGRGRRRKRSVASPTEPATCGGLRSIHETKPSRVSLRTATEGQFELPGGRQIASQILIMFISSAHFPADPMANLHRILLAGIWLDSGSHGLTARA